MARGTLRPLQTVDVTVAPVPDCPGALGRVKASFADAHRCAALTRPARSLTFCNYRIDGVARALILVSKCQAGTKIGPAVVSPSKDLTHEGDGRLILGCSGWTRDLVILSVSSHVYTDRRATFHFVLADIEPRRDQTPTSALDAETLSSDDLSSWLRDIDAAELVLIVDARQSEATVSAAGFKPGPMGSRGLGQLA